MIDRSLIKIEPVDIKLNSPYTWLFFSSVNAARLFLEKTDVIPFARIGAVGDSTASFLVSKGIQPNFIGKGNDTLLIGKDFSKQLSNTDRVLFPISSRSKRKIQSQLKREQIVEVIIYNTELAPEKVPPCDYYLFTSPSNVESFLELNELRKDAQVWCLGNTTQDYLQSRGIRAQKSPNTSVEALIQSWIDV